MNNSKEVPCGSGEANPIMEGNNSIMEFRDGMKVMVEHTGLWSKQEKTHKGTQLLVLKHKTHTDDNNSTHHIKMDRLSRNLSMSRRKFS